MINRCSGLSCIKLLRGRRTLLGSVRSASIPWRLAHMGTATHVSIVLLRERRPPVSLATKLIGLLPALRVIVLVGRTAQTAWDRAGLQAPWCACMALRSPWAAGAWTLSRTLETDTGALADTQPAYTRTQQSRP
jgi:hypothetical protein